MSEEKVGESFKEDSLKTAQKRAWESLRQTAAQLKEGHSEKDALAILKEVLKENGVEKIWHPPQIRFGKNTLLPFGKPSDPTVTLQTDDIFFLDIGPVFEGHEGDVGETYVIGTNTEHSKIASDAKAVFNEVRDHWLTSGKTGQALYDFARGAADKRGWDISLEGASGHRVSEFPHSVHYRGKLRSFEREPTANRWILEIHLYDKQRRFGAFFEDLL